MDHSLWSVEFYFFVQLEWKKNRPHAYGEWSWQHRAVNPEKGIIFEKQLWMLLCSQGRTVSKLQLCPITWDSSAGLMQVLEQSSHIMKRYVRCKFWIFTAARKKVCIELACWVCNYRLKHLATAQISIFTIKLQKKGMRSV